MKRWFVGTVLMLHLMILCAPFAGADDSMKGSFKKMGKAVGQAGKEVGKSAAKAGRALGRESQKVWYRGVEVSKPALERARSETRRALQKSLDAMPSLHSLVVLRVVGERRRRTRATRCDTRLPQPIG